MTQTPHYLTRARARYVETLAREILRDVLKSDPIPADTELTAHNLYL